MKEVDEVEPNNDFAKPQPIAMNATVNGVADNEDVDYYVVEAKKGERITAEVEGMRLGIYDFDPYVAILDTQAVRAGRSATTRPLVWQDGFTSIVAPEDGKYIIQVRESAYAGNGACLYRLHVGNFPRPTAVVAGRGQAGRDAGRPLDRRRARRDAPRTSRCPPTRPTATSACSPGRQGIAPSRMPFRLDRLGNVIEVEPNDDQAERHAVRGAVALNGVIGSRATSTTSSFTAKKGQVSTSTSTPAASARRSTRCCTLREGRRGDVAGNDDSGGPDSYFRFNAPEDGEYVIMVLDQLGKGGAGLRLPDRGHPGQAGADHGAAEQSQLGDVMAAGAEGEPAGDPDQRAQRADFGGELNAGHSRTCRPA